MSDPQEPQIEEAAAQEIPAVLPVLPLRDTVVFPDTMIPLTIGQERSIKLIDDVLAGDRLLAMVTSRDADVETPGPDLLYPVGTVGLAHKMIKLPDGTMRILVQGLQRVRVKEYLNEEPYLVARTEKIEDVATESKESDALRASLLSVFSKIVALVPYLPEELEMAAANVEEPGPLTFLIASTMRIKAEDKQALLEEDDVEQRMRKLIGILTRELDVLELGSKIQSDVRGEIDKSQREYFLRQQMRAIQQELGETDDQEAEINELRQKVEELALPEEADKAARRELDRLSNISPQSAEYPVIRTYLDWIITLPWNVHSEDNLDVAHAREILDRDHYDLEKVKDRILEFLAVRKLKDDLHGPILCFVGPPGVGKTSLGHSIAEAMGRKFERISVGGVRDEAEVRGHRRTYVGAMPGIIVRAMRDAGTNNPLFMIDEIDKMGADWRGDPSSAMLEVLDPEQNVSFRDHYMDLPFDLSRVLFITTANQLEPIPGPLRDRMEIINLAGYTIEEKLHIAKRYLVPRQSEANGLKPGQVTFKDEAIVEIITSYTREAGVRNVEREIGTICRKLAREVAEASNGSRKRFTVNLKRVHDLLGRPRAYSDVKRRTSDPGVATGLAWTPVGGDILFIEATAMPGNGHLTVTGQLGDVMKESAMAAMSYVRTHSPELGLEDDYFQTHDIHIHVPAGAIPKDGPSAGVTMATAICSLVTDTPVNNDVAMTGEVTLTGQVLPIGGLKEKTLAAQRAGITTVILPSRNEADLEDVPEELRKGMTFVPVDRVEQVWQAAMGLSLDARAAELIEAGDLIEEAGELLEKARRKTGRRAAAAAGDENGRPAKPPVARKPAAKKPAAKKPAAKKPRPRSRRPGARRPRPRRRGPRRRRRSPRAPPRRPRPRAAAAAARSSRRCPRPPAAERRRGREAALPRPRSRSAGARRPAVIGAPHRAAAGGAAPGDAAVQLPRRGAPHTLAWSRAGAAGAVLAKGPHGRQADQERQRRGRAAGGQRRHARARRAQLRRPAGRRRGRRVGGRERLVDGARGRRRLRHRRAGGRHLRLAARPRLVRRRLGDGHPRRDPGARVPAHLPRRHRRPGDHRLHGLRRPAAQARRQSPGGAGRGLRHLAVLGGGGRPGRHARRRVLVGLRARRRSLRDPAGGGGGGAAPPPVRAAVRRARRSAARLLALRLVGHRPRDRADRQDGRRRGPRGARAAAGGAHRGGRGRRHRAPGPDHDGAEATRSPRRAQAPPLIAVRAGLQTVTCGRDSCPGAARRIRYCHTTMRYARQPPGRVTPLRPVRGPALDATSAACDCLASRRRSRIAVHREPVTPPAGEAQDCEGVLILSAQERETANVGAGLWKGLGMWAWILFRISGLVLAAYLFVHIWVISQGRVSGAETLNSFFSTFDKPFLVFLDSVLVAAVLYHALNGVRIILMDFGIGIQRHKAVFWICMLVAIAVLWAFAYKAIPFIF